VRTVLAHFRKKCSSPESDPKQWLKGPLGQYQLIALTAGTKTMHDTLLFHQPGNACTKYTCTYMVCVITAVSSCRVDHGHQA